MQSTEGSTKPSVLESELANKGVLMSTKKGSLLVALPNLVTGGEQSEKHHLSTKAG